jgi:hypothetical protein
MMNSLTEKRPFQLQTAPATMYVFVRRWVKWSEIPTFFNENLERIAQAMLAADAPPQYPPSMLIHKVDAASEASELSVAVQTNKQIPVLGGGTILFPAGQVLTAQHIGYMGQTEALHQAMTAYVEQNRLMVGITIEEYRDVKTTESDAHLSETWVIYRLYDGVEVPRILC